ncbi:3-keto-disaccharide hydrolase [Catalinimonas alkaloidigena]|uniref:3-keto-disaccharide hydrolase n=1 Tax=Catalinimonas alkaloidigena TaxID=1075417 RepID=UPI002406E914|nr:DUF1080 domain-containing protein [Catalinimonas alkaloidigena]
MNTIFLHGKLFIFFATLCFGCQPGNNEDAGQEKTQETDTSSSPNANADWQVLFNGKDLGGWHEVGGDPNFYIEDSVLVGLTEEGLPNTFLVTDDTYDDFVLELDFKIDDAINSGVQIRSSTYENDTTTAYISGQLEESTRDWEAGRFHGYQIEIDPSERAWTGGFYEEGGRGWLQPLTDNEEAQQAFRPGEWNHMRIEAQGNQFKSYINGVAVADHTDDMASSGHIGLQLHGAGREEQIGQEVRYKNIKIREL